MIVIATQTINTRSGRVTIELVRCNHLSQFFVTNYSDNQVVVQPGSRPMNEEQAVAHYNEISATVMSETLKGLSHEHAKSDTAEYCF